MTSKKEELSNLKTAAQGVDCPLREQATQIVFGEGDPDADVLFIGEAPGKNEDETGRPFVGRAGRQLTEWLNDIGLERGDVYIANIEKFRPPDNRDPRPTEISACFPILKKQIEIIEPKLIVTLGRHALQRMLEWEKGESLPTISMGDYHGKIINSEVHDVRYFPIYHPAATLYNRSLEPKMRKAFQKIKSMIA
jgi:DNA polymerase